MRFRRESAAASEGDMTPMIDMAFQLIAFFMVLLNFSEAEISERIRLPVSELAKPAESPLESPITLQLTRDHTVLLGRTEVPIDQIKALMQRERDFLKYQDKSPATATVIIRADAAAQAGEVQRVMQLAQQAEFERFVLRAEEKVD